ncbi:MAG: hypothetical protein AAF999_18390 [Pseudomonadota bacterium]
MKIQFKTGKYTAEAFTIGEVVASLSAQKTLFEESVNFLAKLAPDFTLDKVTVRVASLATSSLLRDLIIEVYGENQTRIEQKVAGSLEEVFGTDVLTCSPLSPLFEVGLFSN